MGREIGDLAGLGRGVRYVVVSSADDGLGRAGEQINTSEFGCRIHKNVGNILLSRGGGEASGARRPPAGATYLVASAVPSLRPSSVPPGSSSSRVSRCCRRTPPPLRAGLTLPFLTAKSLPYLYETMGIPMGIYTQGGHDTEFNQVRVLTRNTACPSARVRGSHAVRIIVTPTAAMERATAVGGGGGGADDEL